MIVHALGVVHIVEQLDDIVLFFEKTLSLPVRERSHAAALLDNGSVSIRLVRESGDLPASEQPLIVDVAVTDLEESASRLLHDERLRRGAEAWLTPTRKVIAIETPWPIRLLLGKTFDEDELGIVYDLDINLTWSEDAVGAVQSLAAFVPVTFRGLVREKTVARAEELAVEGGHLEVDQSTALSALIQVTPFFQLETLRERLRSCGFDPSLYEDDFAR